MITSINQFKRINENSSTNLLKKYNEFMDFVNDKIDYVLSREGELNDRYFEIGLETRMNNLIDKIKTVNDIIENNDEFEYVYAKLIDGYNGLKSSGKY